MEFRKYLRTLQKMLVVTQNVHVHYLNGISGVNDVENDQR